MFKPNNKKMLTVLIAVAMVFSAFAILSFAAQPAYASSSGSFTLNPTVFAVTTSTVVAANGGSFGSGATVTFYSSTTNSFTSGSNVLGKVTLPPGTTTLSNTVVKFSTTGLSAGTYYTAASDDSGATFASGPQITISSLSPSIAVSPSSAPAGTTVTLTSTTGFDSGSTVTIYLNYAAGPVLISSVTSSDLSAGVSLTVPTNEPEGTYNIVAQESSSSSTNYGITADASLGITPSISVTPSSISGATTSTFTITGHGFPASDSFKASTTLNPISSITVAGVDALNPAFTTDTTGSLTVTTTGLASAISTYGTAKISMTDSSGTAFGVVGTILVSVSNPSQLGFLFDITPTSGSVYNVNDTVAIDVWNFPASQSVQFYMGTVAVGSVTTDSNGAGTLSAVVPPLPGGSYSPVAVVSSSHLTTQATSGTVSYKISPYFQAVDPTGAALIALGVSTGEYVPSSGMITIQAYGLNPASNGYDFYDAIVAPSPTGVYASSLVTKISVGMGTSNLLAPAANGTLIFTYSPDYSSLSPSTGTAGTISSANSVSGYDSNSYAYYAIGSVSFTSPAGLGILASGSTGNSLKVSGLIPYTAALYPGVMNTYNAYVGSTELTLQFTNHNSVVVTGTTFDSGDSSMTFSAPSSNGLFNLSIVYNGQSISTAPGAEGIVISSSGSSASSGTLMLLATTTGYDVIGYGYDQAVSPVTFYYVSSTGVSSGTSETLTSGAFVDTSILGTTPSVPAGTYAVFTKAVSSGTSYFVYSSYTVVTNITLSDIITSEYNGFVGDSVTLGATGLASNQFYTIYFANLEVGTLTTNAAGTVSGKTFVVPVVQPGMYSVNLTVLSAPSTNNTTVPSSASVVASAGFQVKAVTSITLSTDAPVAFPGQLVTFSWTPATMPTAITNGGNYGPVEVTVYLNGSALTTFPAAAKINVKVAYLNGSFLMPNDPVGTYFYVTFGWTQVNYHSLVVNTFTQTSGAYIQLVSGNGALLTGISSSQIASLTADVSNAVTTSMKVPLSELNASVVAINGVVAKINTAFGNMTATLKAINATVASIESGQVLVQTDLGSISTSLSSLNASLKAFNNNVVTINTTLGQVKTSLSSIGTTVTANAAGIATVKTDIGTVQGQIVSSNGNMSTIKTSLGTLTTNVSAIQKTTSGFSTLEIFLIVIVILVLITLVLSFMAISSVNRVSKKLEEQKKQ